MGKWTYFVVLIGAGLFGFIALFVTLADRANPDAEAASAGPSVKLVATNFKFDQAEYTAKAGEKTTVSLSIKEGFHAVHISGNGVDINLDKQNPTQAVTFDKAGTYDIICSLPCGEGHANMKSKLVVQ